MARRRVVKARGLKKAWSSAMVNTGHGPDRAKMRGTVIAHEVADDGKRYDSSAYAYRSHAQSLGVPGKIKTQRQYDTQFSITGFNRTPLGEVMQRLNNMTVKTEPPKYFHDASTHINEFAKLYEPASVAPKGLAEWFGTTKFHYVVMKKDTKEEIRMYFSGNDFYFIRISGNKISASYKYKGKDHAEEVMRYDCIAWKEHAYTSEE